MIIASLIIAPNATFIIELLTFLLMLWALAKWVYPPVINAAEGRQKMIDDQIRQAEQLRKNAQVDADRVAKDVAKAKARAQAILDQGKKQANQEIAEGHEKGLAEVERLLQKARTEIAQERQQAFDSARNDLVTLVMDVSAQVIPHAIDSKDHQQLIADTVAAADMQHIEKN